MWPFKRKSPEDLGEFFHARAEIAAERERLFAQAIQVLGEDEAIEICIMERCDFLKARDAFGQFFAESSAEAARDGEVATYKTEFVAGWRIFSESPSAETATAWIRQAPDYKPMIVRLLFDCCPGGAL